jgi:hypothetical protein
MQMVATPPPRLSFIPPPYYIPTKNVAPFRRTSAPEHGFFKFAMARRSRL